VDSEVLPVINGYRERTEFPWPLIQALIADRDITGASRPRIAPRLPGRVKQATDLGRHHFTMNWRGRPLTSHQVIMQTSAATSTGTGLRVRAELDTGAYDTGSTSATPRWKPCR
jgi:Rhodopirellula transposase DDE domain